MAITFPRAMPDWTAPRSSAVQPTYNVLAPRERSGALLRIENAEPFWTVELVFPAMRAWDIARLKAWYNSMQSGIGSFLCHDYSRPLPDFYRTSGLAGLVKAGTATPFTGPCVVDALTAFSLSLSGLPDGFVLQDGDYIGLSEDSHYGLTQVSGGAVANSSGEATVDVAPPLNLNLFTTSAVAQVFEPVAEFVPMTFNGSPSIETGQVTITGVQKI